MTTNAVIGTGGSYDGYMAMALDLARNGVGWADPNPLVGAVVVRDGEILATGYHDRYRGPHAERMAFDYADTHGIDLTGATIVDTLEPCCHVGSQPACTDLIIAHGIARVVVGSIDPNPIVAGNGLRILEQAGTEVVRDVMRAECDAINAPFFHYITTGLPYLVDGRRREGENRADYETRRRRLYSTYAAVLAEGEPNVSIARLVACFDGPVQSVAQGAVTIDGHRPLYLDATALAGRDPYDLLRELGRRKIDSLIVEDALWLGRLGML
ncbi:bifunctional diaminohydroxyphosphoribosylaminopyrimidine deaminase/5-amino-6-(5-phosphoribosylamino)uracil reductase RibD [Bifidobacterium sp. UBA744]|uniref:bifunctional diaminohydroxyphosphoribosylaminopyrimidine deaminase/5-amino-6-(5-phosphoribosylamino)uracil reductase RibD n=1 Tax=Bifidobacterium sp. UBA744 TaxID=1946112 RepID=UPI0025BEC1E1|nr:bifunctional diaminohydroxyphosphoribosylaminopyrimidine deaminase/5-amino-6-(5-phosphoribosylamino)uracil reductase RibD [Bifidobacterium sp. UBA744]